NCRDGNTNPICLEANSKYCSALTTYTAQTATPYPIRLTLSDHHASGTVAGSTLATVADLPLLVTSIGVAATEGVRFNDVVAKFFDRGSDGSANDYTATIQWGDGQTSTGTITSDGKGGFLVKGSNTYGEESQNLRVSVQISDVGGSKVNASGR